MSVMSKRACVNVDRLLAAKSHDPVVYFVRVGRHVKIGTSTNLRGRMQSLYLGLDDVLAVVPGGKDLEGAYHRHFAASRIERDGRVELFGLNLRLRCFLARRRLALTEAACSFGVGSAVAVASGVFLLGAAVSVVGMGACFMRPGWEWR
jgi:hypothetical protein